MYMKKLLISLVLSLAALLPSTAKEKVLVLYENGGWHKPFTDLAVPWLQSQKDLEVTAITDTKPITEDYLKNFDVFIQLDYPPYMWTPEAVVAFEKYIGLGLGGYVGMHHATLLGEFDGYPMWTWFSDFMGGIRYRSYVASLSDGKVCIEDKEHPVVKGLPPSFTIPDDEWYTYDKDPRSNPDIHVIANVDETTVNASDDLKMGDHPVIWTNTKVKARNVYFQFGHSPELLKVDSWKKLMLNAIHWTAGTVESSLASEPRYPRFKALVYWRKDAEEAHIQFARQTLEFYRRLNFGDGFALDSVTSLSGLGYSKLKEYSVIILPDEAPKEDADKKLFEQYIENGGGALLFHGAGFTNYSDMNWPWLRNLMGGSVFKGNSWPPVAAKCQTEGHDNAITATLPDTFISPENEYYVWDPSPRKNPDVKVFVSLSPENFPLGLKDVLYGGDDYPLVWSNMKYRMVYLNFGHGDQLYSDAVMKLLFYNALRWVVSRDPRGNPFAK